MTPKPWWSHYLPGLTPDILCQTTSSPYTCLPCGRTWWLQARAMWSAAANTRSGSFECCTRYASKRRNSWWTVGEWIFLCKGCLERGRKRVCVGGTVYKEATINKAFVSFLDLDFQVHCFGFEKKQKGPHGAKLPSFQSVKAFRKPIQAWVCWGF